MSRKKINVYPEPLEELLGLGLVIDESPKAGKGLGYEAALCRWAGSVVHAIAIAVSVGDRSTGSDADWRGWASSGEPEFDGEEAGLALEGVATILRNLPRLAEDFRDAWPKSPSSKEAP